MRIIQTAAAVPPQRVTNSDLAALMPTTDAWITSRTGIRTRHVATTQTNYDLALAVATQLLATSDYTAADLDFILVATMSPDYQTPGVANRVQGALGAVNALACDLNAACAGFVYGLEVAAGQLARGAQAGLVIGSEVLSSLLDWTDRSTAVLFGDGAAGVLVTAAGPAPLSRLRSFGQDAMQLTAGGRTNHSPFAQTPALAPAFAMNGRAVYHFATTTVADEVLALLATAGLAPTAVDGYYVHQANVRIIQSLAKRLGVAPERLPHNLAEYGNTSAASVPLLLHDARMSGRLTDGQQIILCGFGGGLNVAAMLLTT
ncbi:beta-ketoacyl-ACP synthase 3 [Lacticaseibacillus absianus]|uniref:beta-ketoacyl-ACP synthase 3 n=1 Tax=Lacticaseibacillus absianus TaxID=2729623 RepID=UPI0015C97FE8|nr:beta-ketoacyl-ACP synthase 3 [Lacticaseibacillus absianus]